MADTTSSPNFSVDDLKKHAMKVFKDATKGYERVYYKFLMIHNYDDLNEYAISVFDALVIDNFFTEQARELFKPRSGLPVLPDVAILTMVMITYASSGNTNAALMVYKQMLATDVTPTSLTYAALITALTTDSSSDFKYVGYAKKYFLEMLDRGIKPHSSSYISVFQAIAARESVEKASEFLKQIKAKGFIPESNVPCFEEDNLTESMNALNWHGDLINNTSDKQMKKVFSKWNQSYLKKQSKKMCDALLKDGYREEYIEFYKRNYATGILPMVALYTSVIEAYLERGKTKGALEAYQRMLATGVAPNSDTYTVLIKGLSADPNFVRDAKKCLLEMMERGMRPNAATYTAVIESFAKQEDKASEEECKELVEVMMDKGFVPNAKAMMEVLKGRPTTVRRVMNIVLSKLKG
ncbi:pentatricopeptide repeat-containing protein At1g22960, mitochondrial-like [Rosa rugosa]|uniref:pentatricopeptide repeat-containing protein At1g22960, mitochondrial-like n=1 Tax=Rosa rugosa TaxID=74645 RepID=UPI002B40D404|nr:pentatricopeptide repeat-containing protein At1g22960, mitochondrial-like [Rosa rugosa]